MSANSLPTAPGWRSARLDQRLELRPEDGFSPHAGAQSAVDAGDDVLSPDHARVLEDALRHQFRVLDPIREVADDAGDQDLAVRQLDLLPHLPFVIVAGTGRLERVSTDVDFETSFIASAMAKRKSRSLA